jgi:hypothetical protein
VKFSQPEQVDLRRPVRICCTYNCSVCLFSADLRRKRPYIRHRADLAVRKDLSIEGSFVCDDFGYVHADIVVVQQSDLLILVTRYKLGTYRGIHAQCQCPVWLRFARWYLGNKVIEDGTQMDDSVRDPLSVDVVEHIEELKNQY